MANKYIKNNSGQLAEVEALVTSSGAGDSGKIVALDATGKLDVTVMPTGLGVPTVALPCTETLTAGNVVSIYDNGGTASVRKADCSNGRRAHGYVLSGFTSGTTATVYLQDNLTGLSSLTVGAPYYLSTTGAISATAPTTSGYISQEIGTAASATVISFVPKQPITLA